MLILTRFVQNGNNKNLIYTKNRFYITVIKSDISLCSGDLHDIIKKKI